MVVSINISPSSNCSSDICPRRWPCSSGGRGRVVVREVTVFRRGANVGVDSAEGVPFFVGAVPPADGGTGGGAEVPACG